MDLMDDMDRMDYPFRPFRPCCPCRPLSPLNQVKEMSSPSRTEGIILQNTPYRNDDQILTLFTADQGLLKLFCNKSNSRGQRYTPLMKVEIVYREKKSEIFACEEISLLQSNLQLRNELSHLQVGCEMIRAINKSQVVGRSAPLLYQLMVYYLDKISHVEDPWILDASFKLKILNHEGLLAVGFQSLDRNRFTTDEADLLFVLAYTQSYQQLAQMTLPIHLKAEINSFFLEEIG